MVITVDDCKTLLFISDSTYDAFIKKMIPKIEASIVKHCNNEFVDRYNSIDGVLPVVYFYSNEMYFQNSDNSLNKDDGGFSATNFKVGDSVRFYNTLHNDYCYTIETIADTKIVFEDVNSIIDEDTDNTIVFARVTYPDEVEIVASEMINYKIQNSKIDRTLKSEKFDDYSYTNFSGNELVNGYPKSIMEGLENYCSMFLKTIPYSTLYYRQE